MSKTKLQLEAEQLLETYPDFTTISVQFPSSSTNYTYRVAEKINKGDYVVVDAPSTGFTVVHVVQVHIRAHWDMPYKWISQKVDHSLYRNIEAAQLKM